MRERFTFKIDDEKIKIIIDSFKTEKIKKKQVESIQSYYNNECANLIRKEYVSHLVSAIEKIAREKTNNKLFAINLIPRDFSIDNLSDTFTGRYRKHRYYNIFYQENMDEEELRLGIAHELAHLLFIMITKDEDLKNDEILCSIFAIIAIADRTDFYKNRAVNFTYDGSFDKIVRIMSLLHNKNKQKHNMSS